MINIDLNKYVKLLDKSDFIEYRGSVSKVIGLTIESEGPEVNIGELCQLKSVKDGKLINAEVVGFKENRVLLMPLGEMTGIGPGSEVIATGEQLRVKVGKELVGRILDGVGNPIDGKGDIKFEGYYHANNKPPHPLERKRITEPLALGIKAIDISICILLLFLKIFSALNPVIPNFSTFMTILVLSSLSLYRLSLPSKARLS